MVTFPQFAWRFFTGAHLDGVARSNATWFRRGTTPFDRLTWWTAKSRFSRMMWRWGFIAVPVVVRIVYADAPVIRVNLVLFIAAVYGPFLSWRIAIMVIARIPRVRVVTVMIPHDEKPFQVNADIDEVVDAIPVHELEEEAKPLTDLECVPDLEEIETLLRKRGNRRDLVIAFLVSYAMICVAIGFVLGCEFYRLWLRRLHKISIQIRKAQRGGK